jgi:hypothetical protein
MEVVDIRAGKNTQLMNEKMGYEGALELRKKRWDCR